jgi:hypothetical protein
MRLVWRRFTHCPKSNPTTPRAFSTTLGGYGDGFIAELYPDGRALVYSTFFGGSRGVSDYASDHVDGIVVASNENVYVTGATDCDDFPTTAGAFQTTRDGSSDAFVAKLALPSPNVNAYVQAPVLVSAAPGGMAAIPIQYGNRGAITATLITLTATLSNGLTYVSDTSGIPPTLSSNRVTWSLADLAFRDSEQFALQIRLSGAALIGARYPLIFTIGSAGVEDDTGDNTTSLELLSMGHVYLPFMLR